MTTLAEETQKGFEQCVAFVEHVTGIGYGLPTASSYLTTYAAALHNTPKLGDIAVWRANSGGAGSGGHVAIVTGLSPSGQATVTGTNWPEGSGARSMVLGVGNAPTAFLTPSDVNGSTPALPNAYDVTGGTANASSFTAAGDYQTLDAAMKDTGPFGVKAPAQFFGWLTQGALLRRIGFTAAGLLLVLLGIMLVLRRDVAAAVQAVAK